MGLFSKAPWSVSRILSWTRRAASGAFSELTGAWSGRGFGAFPVVLVVSLYPAGSSLAAEEPGAAWAPAKVSACRETGGTFDLSRGLGGTGFDTSRLVAPDRALVYRDAMLGEAAVRVTWMPGDKRAGGFRAELADQCAPREGVPVFYTLSFLIPHQLALDAGNSVTIAQFHSTVGRYKPMLALRYRSAGHLDVTLNHRLAKKPGETPRSLQLKPLRIANLPRGRWHTIRFLAVWSPGRDGRLDIVFNGRPVFRYEGRNTYPDQKGAGPYFKFGLYPSGGNSRALSLDYAHYKRVARPGPEFLEASGIGAPAGVGNEPNYRDGDPRIVVDSDK